MSRYRQLFLDPRWQRKRLEILQRADFKCEECGAAEKTLHVHHEVYHSGANPWDYGNDELTCLCADCHEFETFMRKEIAEALVGLSTGELEDVFQLIRAQPHYRINRLVEKAQAGATE